MESVFAFGGQGHRKADIFSKVVARHGMPKRQGFLVRAAGYPADETDGRAVAQDAFADGSLIIQVSSEAVGDLALVDKYVVILDGFHLMSAHRHRDREFPVYIGLDQFAVIFLGIPAIDLERSEERRVGKECVSPVSFRG